MSEAGQARVGPARGAGVCTEGRMEMAGQGRGNGLMVYMAVTWSWSWVCMATATGDTLGDVLYNSTGGRACHAASIGG